MAIQDMMSGLTGGALGGNSGGGKGGYEEITLPTAEFIESDQTSLSAGKFNQLGFHRVGANREEEVGQNTSKYEAMEQGRPYIDLQNGTPSAVDGVIRIRHEDPYGDDGTTIKQERTEEFRQSTKSERIVLPRATSQGHKPVSEEARISIYFKPDNDGVTVSASNSIIRLPISRRKVA